MDRVTLPKHERREAGGLPDDGELDAETLVKLEGGGREFSIEVLDS